MLVGRLADEALVALTGDLAQTELMVAEAAAGTRTCSHIACASGVGSAYGSGCSTKRTVTPRPLASKRSDPSLLTLDGPLIVGGVLCRSIGPWPWLLLILDDENEAQPPLPAP
jgi:hypothetical protein